MSGSATGTAFSIATDVFMFIALFPKSRRQPHIIDGEDAPQETTFCGSSPLRAINFL
ncbi:conserved hypothetical protein [Ricinus communis]|uniref:Uncharacterized protein n=1 Tax=Ricinus communis TaxID=3988 RepID=B9TI61_RICCO|nr:conserved hypothetical protein [Ricinus communis]